MRLIATLAALAMPGPALACLDGQPFEASLGPDALMTQELQGFEAAFQHELRILNDAGLTVGDAFRFGRCRLNEDEQPILLVRATGAPFCEAECGLWGLEERAQLWEVVLAGTGEMRVAGSTSMGRADLIFWEAGQPEIVHKYDGTMWRDALDGLIYGEVFELPSADGWQPDASGFVGLATGSAGPNGEAVLALQALSELRAVPPAAVEASLTSLNADDVPEVVLQGVAPELCDGSGCMAWIFTITDGQALLIGDATAQGNLEVGASETAGWRDLIAWSNAGAHVLSWTGTNYE